MNRRNFLKSLLGTTIAVSVPLPFVVEDPDVALNRGLRYWRAGLSEPITWDANFTILNIETISGYYREGAGFGTWLRVIAQQNGRPDRAVYAVVQCDKEALSVVDTREEILRDIKASIAEHAKKKGWIKREA